MTDHEALIDAAAAAILEASGHPFKFEHKSDQIQDECRALARAALAVFEKAEAADWEYREQVIAGFPRPKNVRIERQRRRPAGPWEQVPE